MTLGMMMTMLYRWRLAEEGAKGERKTKAKIRDRIASERPHSFSVHVCFINFCYFSLGSSLITSLRLPYLPRTSRRCLDAHRGLEGRELKMEIETLARNSQLMNSLSQQYVKKREGERERDGELIVFLSSRTLVVLMRQW